MSRLVSLFLAFGLMGSVAQAEFVQWKPGATTLEKVVLNDSGTVKLETRDVVMAPRLGAGLRTKFGGAVKVTVAELFASAGDKFVRTEAGAMDSILLSEVISVHQTFLRNVTADQIQSAYLDGFNKNAVILKEQGYNIDASPFKEFIAYLGQNGQADKGQAMTVTIIRGEAKTTVVFENAQGPFTFEGNEKLAKAVLSLWFGESADDGIKALKMAFINGENKGN